MTFGEKLRNYLKAANLPAVPAEQRSDAWVKAVDVFVEVERPPGKPPRKKAVSKMSEEEWIVHLEAEPALRGVDVRRELGRAQFWCKENNRICTRKFFVNWLGKAAHSAVMTPGAGQSSFRRVDPNTNVEPQGWYAVAVKLYGEFAAEAMKADGWAKTDDYYRKAIVKAML